MSPENRKKIEEVKASREDARKSIERGERMLKLAKASLDQYPEETEFVLDREAQLIKKRETFNQMNALTDTILQMMEERG